MSRGPLEWLVELRERAEQRAGESLRAHRADLERARALGSGAGAPDGGRTAAGELCRAAERRGWLAAEVARREREVEEARALALRAHQGAEQLRRLLAGRDEARRRLRCRREELDAQEARPSPSPGPPR